MPRSLSRLGTLVAILAIPASAAADPILITSSNRSILVSAGVGSQSETTPTFNSDSLSNTVGIGLTPPDARASASLFSLISPTTGSLSGHGQTSTAQDTTTIRAGGHSQAIYFVNFALDQPERYSFQGTFDVTGTDATNRSFWETSLFAGPDGPNPNNMFSFSGGGSNAVGTSGILPAGVYGFRFDSTSDSVFDVATGSTASNFAFGLSIDGPVSPTPEPASLLLLGSGAVGLFGARRLKRRRMSWISRS